MKKTVWNNVAVEKVFEQYPESVRKKLMRLRALIFEVATDIDGSLKLEETLKWGEPAYLCHKGSTIRIDWKAKTNQYAIYFNCKSKLVDTFKERYGDLFKFESNRAIVFQLEDDVPVTELKHCISLALTYHSIKHLPMLGI